MESRREIVTPRTVSGVFDEIARARGGQTAIIWRERRVSVSELVEESRRVASGLGALGIARGDRVAIWMPNAPSYIAVFLACARLGAILVNINSRFRSAELGDILGRSGARILVYWPTYRGLNFDKILADADQSALGGLSAVVVHGDESAKASRLRTINYDSLSAASPLAEDHARADDGCAIFTTSGTTRAPKFVLHTHRSIGDHAHQVARSFGYDAPTAATLLMLPLCGVFGFAQAMASLVGGAPMALLAQYEPEAAAGAIDRFKVTHTNGTDDMFARLLDTRTQATPFSSLRWAGFAAFNMAPEPLVRTSEARGLRLVGLYGTSELQALYACQPLDAPIERRALAGGIPISRAATVRVRDTATGRLLGAGEAGELELAGPSRMAKYFADDEATARTVTEDGFIRTGDLGHLTEDGGFVFQARMGDALRLGGFLVNPVEIESCVLQHPSVVAAQVVAVQHDGRARAVAFVNLAPGARLDEAALTALCRQHLASFKTPEQFVAIDEFPVAMGPNGVKIQRGVLRDMARRLLLGER